MTIRKADGFALVDLIFVVGMIALLSGIAMPRLMAARMTASVPEQRYLALRAAELT